MLIGKTGKKTYNDTYYLYKRIKDENNRVRYEIKPSLKFHAKDKTDYSSNRADTIDNVTRVYATLTIETNAKITNFSPFDKVVSSKGKQWMIEIATPNDDNTMKQYSANPDVTTIIHLKGLD